MAPRATENAKRPPPLDLAKLRATLAARAAEMDAAESRGTAESETSLGETDLAVVAGTREGEPDEGKFARLAADFVVRRRGGASLKLAPPPVEQADAGASESKHLDDSFLVRKGEAQPSVIAASSAEFSKATWSNGWDTPETAAPNARPAEVPVLVAANQPSHDAAEAGEHAQKEIESALARAKADWEAREAARLAEADAQWQLRFAEALAEARAETMAARDSGIELELNRLREDASAMQAVLVDRETALARECIAIEQTRESLQREAHEALARARLDWKNEEDARYAAAEAQWQEKSAKALATARADSATARDKTSERELNGLRRELTAMQAALVERGNALAEAETTWTAETKTRLAAVETQWREKSAKALAEAHAEAEAARDSALEAERNRQREQGAAIQTTLAERDSAFARAEAAWKAESEARLASVEAQWQEKSSKALAKARAEAEATRASAIEIERDRQRDQAAAMQAALAERDSTFARAQAAWKMESEAQIAAANAEWQDKSTKALAAFRAEAERARESDAATVLEGHRAELATMQAALADRETALAQAETTIEQTIARWQEEIEDVLSSAEASWKREEAERLAAAQALWQEQSAEELAQARTEAHAGHDSELERELSRLREEAVEMQAALVARETALARECLAIERSRETWQRETQEVVAKAKAAWKTEEAARLTAAEAQWQKATAKALAAARVQTAPGGDSEMAEELERLRAEAAVMQAALVDRETALAREYIAIEQARDAHQHATQEALAKAKTIWKNEEGLRLAAAEAQLKKQASRVLAEMTARCERAESLLAEATARAATYEGGDQRSSKTEIVLKPDRIGFTPRTAERAAEQPKQNTIRNMILAAVLAASAVLVYPRIAAEIDTVFGGAPAPASPAAPESAVVEATAIVNHAANVRTEASASAPVAWMLERGAKVTIVEQRASWTLVRAANKNDSGQIRQGWIYSSFLNLGG